MYSLGREEEQVQGEWTRGERPTEGRAVRKKKTRQEGWKMERLMGRS